MHGMERKAVEKQKKKKKMVTHWPAALPCGTCSIEDQVGTND